jgi:serine/threonine-protein kinase
VRVLGEGGMGAVWVAQNVTLGVQVALKLIRSEIEGRVDGLSERLLQEARAAAAIPHPAIIQVFDFGLTEQGDPFIAMELLQGESFSSVLKRRGKLSPSRAVRTILPVIEALVVAHQRGIVHRDLKPDNIFLAQQANRVQPKVLDFGIAKLSQSFSANLTCEGTVLGSPAYMSPEQARGETDVDFRTDMWALCVVLYEAIAGSLPFSGANWHGLMWSIMEGAPKSFGEHGIQEAELWRILERGLRKDRAERFPSMFEFGRALAAWLLERGVTRDICNASLKSCWLERALGAQVEHSLFPSDSPESAGAGTADPQKNGKTGEEARPKSAVHDAAKSDLAQARSRIRRSLGFRARTTAQQPTTAGQPATTSSRAWIAVTAAGALLSFSAAVAYSVLRQPAPEPDDEPPPVVVRQPSSDLAISPRRDLLPGAAPLPSVPLSDDLAALAEARELARKGPAAKRPPRTRPAAKRLATDLKDPFSGSRVD